MTYFGRSAVIVRHLRKATNVALEESGTFPIKISVSSMIMIMIIMATLR